MAGFKNSTDRTNLPRLLISEGCYTRIGFVCFILPFSSLKFIFYGNKEGTET